MVTTATSRALVVIFAPAGLAKTIAGGALAMTVDRIRSFGAA
jgi:hypothetical protein